MTTSNTTKTRAPSIKAQLAAAMQLIAELQANQATVVAQTQAAVTTPPGAANQLGSKSFARPILKLVRVDADYRTDEEFARGIQLTNYDTSKRAFAYAMSERNHFASIYQGAVACSQPEYVAPVSGKWPVDHDGFEFGAKVPGTYIAIY